MSSSEVAGKVCSCPGRGQLGFRPGRGGVAFGSPTTKLFLPRSAENNSRERGPERLRRRSRLTDWTRRQQHSVGLEREARRRRRH